LRQEAWLAGTPEGFSAPRRDWIARHKGEARLAEYRVEPGPLEWLIDMMHDAGSVAVEMGGMGAAYRGLNWSEIVAWITGAELQDVGPFWRRQVMRLSAALASEMNRASEADAPYEPST
jgi:hypothetical protein